MSPGRVVVGNMGQQQRQSKLAGRLVGTVPQHADTTTQRRAPPLMESCAAQPTTSAAKPHRRSTSWSRVRHFTICNIGGGLWIMRLRVRHSRRHASMATSTTAIKAWPQASAAHAATVRLSMRTSPATTAMHLLCCKPKRAHVHRPPSHAAQTQQPCRRATRRWPPARAPATRRQTEAQRLRPPERRRPCVSGSQPTPWNVRSDVEDIKVNSTCSVAS